MMNARETITTMFTKIEICLALFGWENTLGRSGGINDRM